jgi:hypothetical protein
MTSAKKISATRALAAKVIYAGLSILRDNGKELRARGGYVARRAEPKASVLR